MGIYKSGFDKKIKACFLEDEFDNFLTLYPIMKEKVKFLSPSRIKDRIYINVSEKAKSGLGEKVYNAILKHQVIKPNDCVIGFGIPTSKSAYITNKNMGYSRLYETKAKYNYDIIVPINNFMKIITAWGVITIFDLNSYNFANLFRKNGFKVIILFSHWEDDFVEFSNGLIAIDEICNSIPEQFNGTLDFCICHPEKLIKKIIQTKPDIDFRYTNEQVTPKFWIDFYTALFSILRVKNVTYNIALLDCFRIYNIVLKKIGEEIK